jgi:O-antigen/teichoic acid export membrane protein
MPSHQKLSSYRRQLREHLSDPLYRTGYLLTIGTTITAGVGLIFWVAAAHLFSTKAIGTGSALVSAMLYTSSVCALGLPTTLVRFLPVAGPARARTIWVSYATACGATVVAAIVVCLTSHIWSHDLGFLAERPAWLVGFVCASVAYTIFQMEDSVLVGLDAAKWVPLENGLFSLAKLLLLFALYSSLPSSGLFIAWSVPAVPAVAVVTWFIARRLLPRAADLRQGVAAFDRRRFISMAAANQFALLFTFSSTLLAPVIVAAATTSLDTAYFYVPWSIASGVLTLAVNSASSLTVESAIDEGNLSELVRRSTRHTLRLASPIALFLVVIAPLLLHIYGPEYVRHSTSTLRLLALSVIPNAVYTVAEAVLRLQQRTVALVVTQAGQCILFISLGLVLLHTSGISGMALAFLISQTAFCIGLSATVMRPHIFRAAPSAAV